MSSQHRVQIRPYDCDAYGHLATARYLRIVHEADSAGPGRLAGTGASWLPRRLGFEFLRPLTAGDELEVLTTSTSDSLREYVLRRAGTEESAATAGIEWRLANSGRCEPAATAAQGEPQDARSPSLFEPPELPLPPPGVFSMERRVLWHDIGSDYTMRLGAYGRIIIDCSIEVGAHFGWSVQRSQEVGIGYVARRLWMEFGPPAVLGDDLRVSSYVSQLKRSTIIRHYLVERLPNAEPVATAHILWVSVDAASGRPIRQPLDWLDDFESNIVRG